ncbi:hypothetical protein [Alkalibacterium pelagium]|uniref:Lipoprotein n=1 Tax=Alkalibacterium pelagium TaxID=426702 RepID=A0A1H7PP24_9LACT|nr:hypothetical protein [Alkalibacterium pelagium]GEN51690.1 hypothetical protein APE02nite_23550 [Alkalibacterium pelagium]SEL37523.1 hypothetical protein SAMN04488099_1235 [Alkalibacterium pelagium]
MSHNNEKIFMLMVAVSIFIVGCSEQTREIEELDPNLAINSFTQSSGSYALPESLEDVEERAEVIVNGRMNGVIEFGNHDNAADPDARITSTLTEVEITEVFKGDALSVGDTVDVTELYYLSSGEISTVEHYVPMEQGEDYLLFLFEGSDGSWGIEYMGFGKYHFEKSIVNQSIQEFSTLGEVSDYQFMTTDDYEIELYEQLFEEAEDRYN